MDSAQHPNLHHQLILPVISPVCTPTPRLGQGWQELIDTKYRPMRVQVVGISVSYLSLPHHPCKVSVSTCISGKGKPKLVAFNSSKEQVQSSHLLYIFQSFWDRSVDCLGIIDILVILSLPIMKTGHLSISVF